MKRIHIYVYDAMDGWMDGWMDASKYAREVFDRAVYVKGSLRYTFLENEKLISYSNMGDARYDASRRSTS